MNHPKRTAPKETRGAWLYRQLLRAYPKDFRCRFGGAMLQLFVEKRRDTQKRRSKIEAFQFWVATFRDLLGSAAALRLERRFGNSQRGRAARAPHGDRGETMTTAALDLKFTFRSLRKNLGFAALTVLTLSLGIGANSAIFSVISAVLLNPLPYPDPDRMVVVWENDRLRGTDKEAASAPDYLDFAASVTTLRPLAAYRRQTASLTSSDAEPERARIVAVSQDFFQYYGRQPALGRTFTASEGEIGGPEVAIVSHQTWNRRFGGSPAALGQSIQIDGVEHEIVGILPAGRLSLGDGDVWVPLRLSASSNRGSHNLVLLGKLQPGVDLNAAQEELSTLAKGLEEKYPDDNLGRGVLVNQLQEEVVGDARPALLVLMAAVGLVLAIACANVAGLLLTRSAARRREIAVRTALGAAGSRLVRQFLAESTVLAGLAGILGLALAYAGTRLLAALGPADLPRLEDVAIDWRVLLFTAGVALATAFMFGLFPVVHVVKIDLTSSLQRGGRADIGGHPLLRRLLVAAQVSLAVMLLIGSGLLVRTFWKLQTADAGFADKEVLTLDLQLPASRYPQAFSEYPNWTRVIAFQDQLLDRVSALPGVRSASLAVNHPLREGWTTRFQIEGRPEVPEGQLDEANIRPVSPDYFETVGIRLLRGRVFTPLDRVDSPEVVLVNEAMVRQHFNEAEDPLKKALLFWGKRRQIVGIVEDVHFHGITLPSTPAMYAPMAQVPLGGFSVLVRAGAEPLKLAGPVRDLVWSMDRDLAVSGVSTLRQVFSESIARPRFNMLLLAIFAGVALTLSMIGVYGVMNHAVTSRTREIGVRVALGARRGDIFRLVLRGGMGVAAIGALTGMAVAALLSRFIRGMLHGVEATDWVTFSAVAGLLLLTALLACVAPARRATRVDPLTALRHEG